MREAHEMPTSEQLSGARRHNRNAAETKSAKRTHNENETGKTQALTLSSDMRRTPELQLSQNGHGRQREEEVFQKERCACMQKWHAPLNGSSDLLCKRATGKTRTQCE